MEQTFRRKSRMRFICVLVLGMVFSFVSAYGQDFSEKLEELDKQGVVLNETAFIEMLENASKVPFLSVPRSATPESLPNLERILRIVERYIDSGKPLPENRVAIHVRLSSWVADIYIEGKLTSKDPAKALEYIKRGMKYGKRAFRDDISSRLGAFIDLIPYYFNATSSMGELAFFPDKLIGEYSANELKADMTITDKEILICIESDGNTKVIKEDGAYTVKYSAISTDLFIACVLAPESLPFFVDFDASTPIILKGICRGVTRSKTIEIDNCIVLESMMPIEGED